MSRLLTAATLAASLACAPKADTVERARLRARPHPPKLECAAGLHRIEAGSPRSALLYVPVAQSTAAAQSTSAPLLLLLHGAASAPERIVERFRPAADASGVRLVAPASRDSTWDGIQGLPGPDVAAIDRLLEAVFDRCAVGTRLAVGGFSDGASYALTLGLANGDLFSHILAFSPCGVSPGITPRGRPLVFISHGRDDEILPFSRCGEPLAAQLRSGGYSVRFEAFEGKHAVPPAMATQAFGWFAEGSPQSPSPR
jgi:phospholipase/carboxylesterase